LKKVTKGAFVSLVTLLSIVFVAISILYTITIGVGFVTILGFFGGLWLYYVIMDFESLPAEKKKEIEKSTDICEKCMKRYYV